MSRYNLDQSYADERLPSEFDTPEHRLWAAVAELAVRDYCQQASRELKHYLFEADWGFATICDLLKLDVDTLREGLRKISEQEVTDAVERCQRAKPPESG